MYLVPWYHILVHVPVAKELVFLKSAQTTSAGTVHECMCEQCAVYFHLSLSLPFMRGWSGVQVFIRFVILEFLKDFRLQTRSPLRPFIQPG